MNRSREDIEDKISNAKIDPSSVVGPTQVLVFDDPLFAEDIRLIELDENVLGALETGDKFTFRGNPDDLATLCSADQTWDVKEAETSNTMLLFRSCLDHAHPTCSQRINENNMVEQKIVGFYSSYLELRIKRIDRTRIIDMLSECKYKGPVDEESDQMLSARKYTMDDLLTCVQSSPAELRNLLPVLRACSIQGYERMLDFDYMVRIVMEIVDLIQSNSWDIGAIAVSDVMDSLSSLHPRDVVGAVLSWFTQPVEESEGSLCSIKKDALCRLYAEVLLCVANAMQLEDFLENWSATVPFDLPISLDQLKGLVIVTEGEQNSIIQLVRVLELPDDLPKRLQVLFEMKPKWTLDEIQPFLSEQVSGKETVGALLMKHCRSSMVGGRRLYCARS